jgi:hypothetical protein
MQSNVIVVVIRYPLRRHWQNNNYTNPWERALSHVIRNKIISIKIVFHALIKTKRCVSLFLPWKHGFNLTKALTSKESSILKLFSIDSLELRDVWAYFSFGNIVLISQKP